jgi:hypothetical protein
MMSTTAKNPDSTPIPVQLSEPEFTDQCPSVARRARSAIIVSLT